jgi:hypothetical protein
MREGESWERRVREGRGGEYVVKTKPWNNPWIGQSCSE